MKKIGEYTVRGTMLSTETERIQLFDGKFNTGYRITKFQIVTTDPDNSGLDVYGTLGTEETMSSTWDLEDVTQLAWSSMANNGSATGPSAAPFNLVDRNNMIVRDLYLYAETNAAGLNDVSYYIEMDKYEFPTWDGAAIMVRNQSQNVN
jgi:hypothetical protein